jgi:dTDP-4-amino-4,6-dideoxygalactose transaminase
MAKRVVPAADLKREMSAIGDDMHAAVAAVLDSGWYIHGKQHAAFEEAFAEFLGQGQASQPTVAGCASGTDALTLALRALGIGPGKTVVTVPNTCVPTAAGIRMSGANLRFVDVDPTHLMLDPVALDALCAEQSVDAVVAVNLYGNPAPLEAIRTVCDRHGAVLVEDCAQSHGARLNGQTTGTIGDAATFSFYPSKNLGAYGDGGAVVTTNEDVAVRLTKLRNYGYGPEARDWAELEGMNSRLDEMQAAILLTKLPHLQAWNERRRAIAGRYDTILSSVPGVGPVPVIPGGESVRHLYVVRSFEREALAQFLHTEGVQTQIHYPHPLHLLPAYAELGCRSGDFPIAERAAAEILSLPVHPLLADAEVAQVVDALGAWGVQQTGKVVNG